MFAERVAEQTSNTLLSIKSCLGCTPINQGAIEIFRGNNSVRRVLVGRLRWRTAFELSIGRSEYPGRFPGPSDRSSDGGRCRVPVIGAKRGSDACVQCSLIADCRFDSCDFKVGSGTVLRSVTRTFHAAGFRRLLEGRFGSGWSEPYKFSRQSVRFQLRFLGYTSVPPG